MNSADEFDATEGPLRRAAEKGDADAAFRLGQLLEERGVDWQAERWYEQAAEAGHPEAAFELGVLMKFRGRSDEAERLFRQAADSGNEAAARFLDLHDALRRAASRERRQVAAAIDFLAVFGLSFAFQDAFSPPNWGYFIALGVIWFMAEVPPITLAGRGLGHSLTSLRVVELSPSWWTSGSPMVSRNPRWWRALLRWLVLVPGFLAGRFRLTQPHPQDDWSGTLVLHQPRARFDTGPSDADELAGWRRRAAELDQLARARPRVYRVRVALVAATGYAFVVVLALMLFAAAGGLAYGIVNGVGTWLGMLTVVLPLFLVAVKTISSLRMPSFVPPRGVLVHADQAPRLTQLVDELSARVGVRSPQRLVLDSEANAGMLLQPRLGPFGPYRSTLILGVPLLNALSVPELRAVVAHELAHLARRHARFDSWIYRLRQAYPALLERMEERGWVVIIARAFLERYAPYFNLYTLALARAHEYEADRIAAAVTSPDAVAAALKRSALLLRFHEHQAWLRVAGDLDPSLVLGSTERPEDVLADHPSFESRVAALGVDERPLPAVGVTAAAALMPGPLSRPASG